jgi:hypothetical protein
VYGNGNGMRWWDLCGNLVGSGIDRLSDISVGSVRLGQGQGQGQGLED